MRVVIAEDLALLREGITRLLGDHGFEVVAAVADGEAFLDAVDLHRPDVCVVDVRLPPSFKDEGVRAALEARRRIDGLPILVLSQYVERTYAAELLSDGRGGANPYGHGLDGLTKRLAALDGTLAIASPVGGPTVLYAEVQCAS